MPSGKQALTPQQKDRILFLHKQGMEIVDIARDVGVQDARKVGGFIRSAINLGRIPLPPPQNGHSLPEAQPMATNVPPPVLTPEAAAPAPAMQASAPPPPPPEPAAVQAGPAPAPAPSRFVPPPGHYIPPAASQQRQPHYAPDQAPQAQQAPGTDGFTGWRQASGYNGGFTHVNQTTRYQVERKEPADLAGVMGQHPAPFSDHELGVIYGQGLYRVIRLDPGGKSYETEVRIGPSYGQARWPRSTGSHQDPRGQDRPGYWRRSAGYTPDDENAQERPALRPSYERSYEFARHAQPPAEASVAAEAIKQMGAAHERTMEQFERTRASGPEAFMSKFFAEQQGNWERRMDEQRRIDDERRKDEQDKWQRRMDEQREETKRREEEETKRHDRELDRMKIESSNRLKEIEAGAREREARDKADREARDKMSADERKHQLELEDRRMKLVLEQHKLERERIEDRAKKSEEELKDLHGLTSERMKELQEATQNQIKESDKKLETELEKQRAHQDEIHKLREKSLDKEYDLNQQILDIKKDSIAGQATSEVFQTINTVIKEFSKGLEKIVDLKKIEAMSPEAQAAAVASGKIDGNIIGEPKKGQETPEPVHAKPVQAAPQPAAQATQAPKNGNGAHPVEAKQGEAQMEQVIQDMVDKPFFKQVLKEWSFHVSKGEDPTTFANMYLEWMRDPMDHEGRKACSMFANFMKPRDWADMLKILGPKLDKETIAVFKSPEAEAFYDGFRAMVVEQIRDYWEQFLAQRKAQRAAAAAAGEATEEAPAEEGAPAKK